MVSTLIWTPALPPDESCHYDHTSAETPFGSYTIEWKSWKDYPGYCIAFGDEFITVENKLDDAKQVAQSDFNKRVRAALTVAPQPQQTRPPAP